MLTDRLTLNARHLRNCQRTKWLFIEALYTSARVKLGLCFSRLKG